MSLPERSEATYDDLMKIPETKIAELIGGDLIVSPRPGGRHGVSMAMLGGELLPPFGMGRGGPGGWWIIDEPELHFERHVLVPDLAGWRRERLPIFPEEHFVTLSPDWVCEILSESTYRLDRIRKMPIYAQFGVRHLWLVDPMKETLEVYRLERNNWLLVGSFEGDAEVRAEPFDAIILELRNLWDCGEPRP